MKQQTKTCALCGNTFARPSDNSQTQWEARRYCTHGCAIKARNMEKNGEKIVARIGLQAAMDAIATAMAKWRRCL